MTLRAVILVVVLGACASAPRKTTTTTTTTTVHHPEPIPHPTGDVQRGLATWYGEPQMTASGERFDKHELTAAHRTLPFGTIVHVTNQNNGRSVDVRINDRGPFGGGRIIDLSEAAAKQLHMIDAGVAPVTIEIVSKGK